MRAMTSFVAGSIRTISCRSCAGGCAGTATQTAPSPTATSPRDGPTGTTAVTRGWRSTGSPPSLSVGADRNACHRPTRLAAETVRATAATAKRRPERPEASPSRRRSIASHASSDVPTPDTPSRKARRSSSSSLTVELLPQSSQRPAGLALHGSDGAREQRGHLSFGQVFVVTEDDARPLPPRESEHRRTKNRSVLLAGVGD